MMEAAAWGVPVAFGPYTQDFQGAAEDLVNGGGGFRVHSAVELSELIEGLLLHRERLGQAGRAAKQIAQSRQGTAARQVEMIVEALQEM
jgi:3-deoxy-D-manno-octulosonic-acid transferase